MAPPLRLVVVMLCGGALWTLVAVAAVEATSPGILTAILLGGLAGVLGPWTLLLARPVRAWVYGA